MPILRITAGLLVAFVGVGEAGVALAAPAPPPPSPSNITVMGKRPTQICGDNDDRCIQAVAEQVWTAYPRQIEYYCQASRTQKQFQRALVEQLGLSSSYDSQSGYQDDGLPHALAEVCGYKATGPRITTAQNWAPWSMVPTDADLAAAFPRAAKVESGDARVNCKVENNGRLEDCHLSDETPDKQGFGKAAMHLVGKFRVNAFVAAQKRSEPLWLDIAVHFGKTASGARTLATPDWTLLPDPAATAALYPDVAAKAGVKTGEGTVDCLVAESGGLGDCKLITEEPAAMGFGAAAMAVAPTLHANLWTRDGQRAPGAHVVVPLRFDAPGADAAKASPSGG